jgi:hypothetical protein
MSFIFIIYYVNLILKRILFLLLCNQFKLIVKSLTIVLSLITYQTHILNITQIFRLNRLKTNLPCFLILLAFLIIY